MFRIAKNLVRTFEQSVQDTLALSQDSSNLDAFFQSIPPNLLSAQLESPVDAVSEGVKHTNVNETLSGLRIVWVDEMQFQLQSFFDYIVGFNDDPVPVVSNQHGFSYPDYRRITSIFNEHCGRTLKVNIWSAKGGTFRDEYISIISKESDDLDDVSLNHDERRPSSGEAHQFQALGFKGSSLIGCQDGLLATGGETLLQDIVRSRANYDLVLYVYNKVSDCVRPITVHIGPDGRLGCNVGYGFLHRIPTVKHCPQQAQQQGQDDNPVPVPVPVESETAFVPSAFTAPPVPTKKKSKNKKGTQPLAMDDYFNEGRDKSSTAAKSAEPDILAPPPQKQSSSD
ncbi:Grh1p [Saccharomyces cerevisiae]|nr:Grh1p [Saccharomyces cerevisiae]